MNWFVTARKSGNDKSQKSQGIEEKLGNIKTDSFCRPLSEMIEKVTRD